MRTKSHIVSIARAVGRTRTQRKSRSPLLGCVRTDNYCTCREVGGRMYEGSFPANNTRDKRRTARAIFTRVIDARRTKRIARHKKRVGRLVKRLSTVKPVYRKYRFENRTYVRFPLFVRCLFVFTGRYGTVLLLHFGRYDTPKGVGRTG